MIPCSAVVSWRQEMNRRHKLWLPLLLLWLILLPVVLVLFPLVLLGGLFFGINAFRLYATTWQILSSLSNTFVEIEDPHYSFAIRIR